MQRIRFRISSNWPLFCALLLVGVNALALSGELRAGRFDLNDSVLHYTLVERVVQAIERGENPLDFWVSEWSLGYPVARSYQMLGHLSLAFIYLILGKTVSILTLFVWARFLLIALLPLSVYISARWLMLPASAAVAAAGISPLLATNGLYGLEYGSFLWRGNGLFTQAVAMHLLLLSLGFGFRTLRGNASAVAGGLLLGLTFLAHFVYGFIGAVSLVLLAFLPNITKPRTRFVRIAALGTVAFAVTAFQLIPMLVDGRFINHSRWEAQWKWDSFGAWGVFENLLRGDLFDFGRLPVLSILVFLGIVVVVFRWRSKSERRTTSAEVPQTNYTFIAGGILLWLLLLCGRPAWGVLFTILGADKLPLHRLIGGVHAFAFFLIGIALDAMWTWCLQSGFSYRTALAAVLTSILLFPALKERALFLRQNTAWSEENLRALDAEAKNVDAAIALAGDSGRAYAGLAATWGSQFKVGSVPFYGILSVRQIPAVGLLYHSMALTGDLMVWFNDTDPAHYRLFNVSSVVAPESKAVPPFLTAKGSAGKFRIYKTPANGYFDVVGVPYAVRVYAGNFYDLNYSWLNSSWVRQRNHLMLDLDGQTGSDLPRLGYGQSLPKADDANPGHVISERHHDDEYESEVELEQPGYLLFKMTYHPGWSATVDGSQAATVMLTPGFVGVKLTPGRHVVQFRYVPGLLKPVLLLFGVLFVAAAFYAESKGCVGYLNNAIGRSVSSLRTQLGQQRITACLTVAGLALLSLPVSVPLLTNQLVSGHDAFSYVPRLIEFHENIKHGVLLPRWAPDLGSGHGQPLFVFNPPLLYYLAEAWYLAGFEPTTAYNLVSVMVVFASAAFMYALGNLYFGRAGGWLAAAAYIYAPYFHVNLYVRQALAEYSAFPFYPLTLYGLGRFARDGNRKFLIVGAAGLAGVLAAHNAAALLFSPIVAVFIAYNAWSRRSWKLFVQLTAGVFLGAALSAFAWLPALMEMRSAHLERLLEGYLNYANHAVYAWQFFTNFWGFGLSVAGPEDGMSFSLGWPHIALLIMAVVMMHKTVNKETRGLTGLFAVLTFAGCFLMTRDSMWIWDRVRLLQSVEFPWRMLGPVAACSAFVIASLGQFPKVNRGTGFAIVLALIVALNLNHVRAERYYPLSPSDWTPEQIAQRRVSVATREEYEPQGVLNRPSFQPERLVVLNGDGKISRMEISPTVWSAHISAQRESVIESALSYFPGWTATLDTMKVPYTVAPQTGQIQLRVPAGEHLLKLEFRRTRPRLYGELTSALAFGVAFAFLWRRAKRRTSSELR